MYANQKNSKHELSKQHYDDLLKMLHPARYDAFMDHLFGKILTAGLLKESADGMKAKGRVLREAGIHFKTVKHEMTADHKLEIHKWIMEIRQSHDSFWGQYKNYQAERREAQALKQQAWEEKQREWAEKQKAWQERQRENENRSRQIKAKIESNLDKNRSKQSRAEDALNNFRRKRDELQDKIYDSYNDNWKSKAQDWLYELNEKIRSIEEQIERLDKWIEEDREKLRNWR